MTIQTIDQIAYQTYLKNASNYANITTQVDDSSINDAFIKIEESAVGWYITDFFFKDKKNEDINQKIYENKNFIENIKEEKGRSESAVFEFSNNSITGELIEKSDNSNSFKKSFFNIAFPVKFNNDNNLMIVMSFNKLPFKIDFEFKSDGNNIVTTPRIQKAYKEFYDQTLNSFKNSSANLKENFEIFIYKIDNYDITYSKFLRFIYGDTSINNYIKQLDNNTFKSILGFPEFINVVISDDKKIEFKNENSIDNTTYTINISKIDNDTPKKILIYKDISKAEADARKLYWQSCASNEATIPNDKKVQIFNSNLFENKNISANYYDVNFLCKNLKPFFFTYHSPGFHVVNFRPSEIYPNPTSVTLKKGDSKIIDFQKVYKEIFVSKILEFNIEQLET